jgi:hypothetical protein
MISRAMVKARGMGNSEGCTTSEFGNPTKDRVGAFFAFFQALCRYHDKSIGQEDGEGDNGGQQQNSKQEERGWLCRDWLIANRIIPIHPRFQ